MLSASTVSALLFSTPPKEMATSSFIMRFISQDVNINPEIWYLPDCNQHSARMHRENAQTSHFPDVYTFYLPLNALEASASLACITPRRNFPAAR